MFDRMFDGIHASSHHLHETGLRSHVAWCSAIADSVNGWLQKMQSTYVVMAYEVVAYMAYVVMAYIVMACIVMAEAGVHRLLFALARAVHGEAAVVHLGAAPAAQPQPPLFL